MNDLDAKEVPSGCSSTAVQPMLKSLSHRSYIPPSSVKCLERGMCISNRLNRRKMYAKIT